MNDKENSKENLNLYESLGQNSVGFNLLDLYHLKRNLSEGED